MEKIDDKTLFGFCKLCNRWVPRDSMVSVHINVYGKGVKNVEEIIRLRICPECFEFEIDDWRKQAWDKKMYRAEEIRESRELSERCDLIKYGGKGY